MTTVRIALTLALTLAASTASAQSLGTFRWRTAPYCNVMHVTVTQVGSFYRLEGYDEQCGGNPRQPLWGIGVMQPNGSITFGLSQTMLPGPVKPVTIRTSIAFPDLNGTWADNAGNSGTLEFSPTCVTGCGGPRTVPVVFDRMSGADQATIDTLRAEIDRLKGAVAALAVRQDD